MERKQDSMTGARGGRKEKERSMSFGNIEEMWKRKREETEEVRVEGEVFGRSKKTPRSPEGGGKKKQKTCDKEKEWVEEMRRWRREMERAMKEVVVKEMNDWKEEFRQIKNELKGGLEELRKKMRKMKEKKESRRAKEIN